MDFEGRPDGIDWEILGELQQNARISYTELGRRVGLTPPAVIERVRRLEDASVITGYRAEVNLDKVGRLLQAIIRISTSSKQGCNINDVLKQMPEILECDRVTGDDCYIMKVAVTSAQHLETLLDTLSVYGRTTTSMVLSTTIVHRVIEPLGQERDEPAERVRVG